MLIGDLEKPILKPQTVSGFLGIPGSQLPRETANTIKSPARPPTKRGEAGGYSYLDVILIKLGRNLLRCGLLPSRTQAALDEVKEWFNSVIADPRLGKTDEDFLVEKKGMFLVAKQTETEFIPEMKNSKQLAEVLAGSGSEAPHVVINLDKFIGKTFEELHDYMKQA